MTANNSSDDETEGTADKRSLNAIESQKRRLTPEVGYRLVEWDMFKAPDERLGGSRRYLRLSQASVPPASNGLDWSIFDRYTNEYVDKRFPELPDEPDPETLDDALETVLSGEEKDRRIELARIARIAHHSPGTCREVVQRLAAELQESDLAVQAEIVGILASVGDEYPGAVMEFAGDVVTFLRPDSHPKMLAQVLLYLRAISEQDPEHLIEYTPKLAVVLEEEPSTDIAGTTLVLLSRVAEVHPDSVVPVTPEIMEYVEAGTESQQLVALSTLGHVAEAYPYVAEQTIPMARRLLESDNEKVCANAAGLLAELAPAYPDELQPTIPRARELLAHDDELVAYNATSILSSLAHSNPSAIEPAIDDLVDALDAEMGVARSNVCRALGYLDADSARDKLEEIREKDPDETARSGACAALSLLDFDSCEHCGEYCDSYEIDARVIYPERVELTCPHCAKTTKETI